ELVKADTGLDPAVTAQQYQRLKGDVVAFGQVIGTGAVAGIVPQLKTDNILASPSTWDAQWIADPQLLPTAVPYEVMAINALDWYINDGGGKGKNICGLLED